MKELLRKALHSTTEAGERSLVLFINTRILIIKGHWDWELSTDMIFCSDVILSDYKWFEGTKAIIHPEDLPHLQQHLRFLQQTGSSSFRFRIITTYGEVKMLRAEDVHISDPGSPVHVTFAEEIVAKEAEAKESAREAAIMQLARKGFELSENIHHIGTWYINTATSEGYYSDAVYRIYGLPPQTLNAHLNTFGSYIHHEDAPLVTDHFNKAYQARIPLHIEFRIVKTDGAERTVKQVTQWRFNEKGEAVIYGITKDITDEKQSEEALEKANAELHFTQRLESFHDQVTDTGHWFLELLTRKNVYSDNYYKVFGLKPQALQGKLVRFMDYIHQDDRNIYQEAIRAMYFEHKPPNIEFRIVRADGKVRMIKQSARVEIYRNSEMVMIGIIEDVTQHKALERKASELDEISSVQLFAYERAEEVSKTGTLTINLQTNETSWSANLFRLLGYKPHLMHPSVNQVLKYIHQNDRQHFEEAMQLATENNTGEEFDARLYRMGDIRNIKVSFRIAIYEQKRFLIGTFRDITEEYEQQQLSAEKVQLVDLLTENIVDRVLVTDQDNTIVFWNRQCEEHYGITATEATRKNFFEILPSLKQETVLSAFRQALKGNPVHEYHIPDPMAKKHIDVHLLPLKNELGEVTGVLHVLHDVTEQYLLKQQLAERLAFIENILETTVDRIMVLDRNMNFIYWNSRCVSHYDLEKSQVTGKNILEIFPGLQNEPMYFHLLNALKGQMVYISPEEAIVDGVYNEVYLIPVKDEKDEVTSVLWVTHDFSKEYRLLKEHKKAFTILDTIEEACYELDEKGNFIFVNRKAEILWNLSKEELLNRNIWKLFPQAVDTALYFAINHAIEAKELVQQEIFSTVLNRKVFVNITPTPGGGVIVAFTDLYNNYPKTGDKNL